MKEEHSYITKYTRKQIKNLIDDLVDDLGLDEKPRVTVQEHFFKTPTQLAALVIDEEGTRIAMRQNMKVNADMVFAVCHEMRHLWQIKTDQKRFMSGYKEPDELSTVAYNLQPAEIDANAYAAIILEDWFEVRPTFKGLSPVIINAIDERIMEIEQEEAERFSDI